MYRRGVAVADSFSGAQFQDEAETANYAIFCPQPTSHEDKQVTIVLGLRVNKYYVLFFQF